jgi:hypothetical protein
MPSQIKMRFSFFLWSDGILPIPSGDKITAGHAHRRQAGALERVDKVAAEPFVIRGGMLWIVHASVHHGSDRLKERAEQARRDVADFIRRMDSHCCFFAHFLPPSVLF